MPQLGTIGAMATLDTLHFAAVVFLLNRRVLVALVCADLSTGHVFHSIVTLQACTVYNFKKVGLLEVLLSARALLPFETLSARAHGTNLPQLPSDLHGTGTFIALQRAA